MSLPHRLRPLPDTTFLPRQGPCASLITNAAPLSPSVVSNLGSAADAGMARLRAAGR